MAFLTQNKAKLCKILIITLVFEKKRQFFRRKLPKIAENCDHRSQDRELKKNSKNQDANYPHTRMWVQI
jgi:hypothetical protein